MEDGLAGATRKLERGIQAFMLKQLAETGFEPASSQGVINWAAALLAHNACLRAGELGIRPDLASKGPYELSDLRDPLTLFERKYAAAGVPVYELVLDSDSDR